MERNDARTPGPYDRARTLEELEHALGEVVVGQERAVRALATLAWSRREELARRGGGGAPRPLVILVVGGTGTGKTATLETLTELLDVPFSIAPATSLVQAGYMGVTVDQVLTDLVVRAGSPQRLRGAWLAFDEIDKLALAPEAVHAQRDVSGVGVQEALLPLLGGTPHTARTQGREFEVDPRGMTFVLAGAFEGLAAILARRGASARVGFDRDRAAGPGLDELVPADLEAFGLMPELVGRIDHVVVFEPLDRVALRRILLESKRSALREERELWRLFGLELELTEDAIDGVVEAAAVHGTGARALRAVLARRTLPLRRRIPELTERRCGGLRVNAAALEGRAEPEVLEAPRGRDLGELLDEPLNPAVERLVRDLARWFEERGVEPEDDEGGGARP